MAASVATAVLMSACTVPGTEKPKPAAVAPGAAAGGVLRVAVTPPGGIDPAAATDAATGLVVSTACETLVNIDPVTGELRPGLAESWVVSNGGSAVQVKLRKKQTFSDGSRLDSRAVVNSVRRLVNPETASHMAELFSNLQGYGEYREAVERGDDRVTLLRGIRVIEPFSFEVLLNRTDPDFMRVFAHPSAAPVNVGKVQSSKGSEVVCAGAYAFSSTFTPGDAEIRLRRSRRHRPETPAFTRGGAGWADEVVFRVFRDVEAGYQAWLAGAVDVAAIPPGRMPEVRRSHASALHVGHGAQVEYIALPSGAESPFRDQAVRQALAAALDRTRIAEEVYHGSRVPATGFIPPVLAEEPPPGRKGVDAGDHEAPPVCTFAPPKETPKLPTQPVKLYFNDEFAHRRLAESVAAQWRDKLGLQVQLSPLSWEQYLSTAKGPLGFDGAFRVSWTPKRVAPAEYVRPLFRTQETETNITRFSDSLVDAALNTDVANAGDEGDLWVAVRKVERMVCERVPMIPVVFSASNYVVRTPGLTSARADGRVVGFDGVPLLRELAAKPA